MKQVNFCDLVFNVLISPLGYLFNHGCDLGLIINLLLFILLPFIGGSIHLSVKWGAPCCTTLICWLCPPLAVCMAGGNCC